MTQQLMWTMGHVLFFLGDAATQKQLITLETNAQMLTLLTQTVNMKKFLMMILAGILLTQDLMQPLLLLMQTYCLMKKYYRAEH